MSDINLWLTVEWLLNSKSCNGNFFFFVHLHIEKSIRINHSGVFLTCILSSKTFALVLNFQLFWAFEVLLLFLQGLRKRESWFIILFVNTNSPLSRSSLSFFPLRSIYVSENLFYLYSWKSAIQFLVYLMCALNYTRWGRWHAKKFFSDDML